MQLNCSKFKVKLSERPLRTKTDKEIKFEGGWTELEARKCFQGQSFTKYLKLTLVFMQNSVLQKKFIISVFEVFFPLLTKFLFLQKGWVVGYYSTKFKDF